MIILAAAPHQCISAEGLNIGPLSSLDLLLLLSGVLTRSTAGPGNTPVKLLLSDLFYLSEQLEMLLTMSHKVEVFKAATFGLLEISLGLSKKPLLTLPPLSANTSLTRG